MNILNIQVEVPNNIAWTKEEIIAAVKSFVSAFVMSKPNNMDTKNDSTESKISRIEISPELMSFVGIAANNDNRDWKVRKEDYLSENL